jgi:TonB family protein
MEANVNHAPWSRVLAMGRAFASLAALSLLLLSAQPVIGWAQGYDVPRLCSDGYAVATDAYGNWSKTGPSEYDIHKLGVADHELRGCLTEVDGTAQYHAISYAVIGLICVRLLLAHALGQLAVDAPEITWPRKSLDPKQLDQRRRRFLDSCRLRALADLSQAKSYIDQANNSNAGEFDDREMKFIDRTYEEYKLLLPAIKRITWLLAMRRSNLRVTRSLNMAAVKPRRQDTNTDTSASPSPCTIPNADAEISGSAVEPKYPDIARDQGATGVTQVKVTLDATGAVTDASVYKSSGNQALDYEAIKAAKATHYTPEIVNCVRTAGTYIFRGEFSGQ